MAIRIHDYYKRYKRSALMQFGVASFCVAALVGILAWALWVVVNLQTTYIFIFCFISLVILNALVYWWLLDHLSEPFKVLSQAVAHVSKDPVVTPPPDIRNKRYERSGLKEMVQTVYELAASYTGNNQTVSNKDSDLTKQILDNLPCGVIVLSASDEIMYSNHTAPVVTDINGKKQIELTFDSHDAFANWLAASRKDKVQDQKLWTRVFDKLPGEEDRRLFDVAAKYKKEDASGIETILVTFDRTSEYINDEEDIDFIAIAAHELRGPLTLIRGYLDMLGDTKVNVTPADRQTMIDRLQVSAERLAGYVNNILNVSRFERNALRINPHETTLQTVLQSILPDIALRAKTQNRDLKFNLADNLPTIAADHSALSEIITNLTDNAIKYSHEGGVVTIAGAAKEGFVEVTVQDDGIGMPASVVDNLFKRFYRSHRSKSAVSGTGLGLYICRALIEAHGGQIWVRSAEGKGSTFGFTIPTFASIADKLKAGDNSNEPITQRSEGWIKNHAMYRR